MIVKSTYSNKKWVDIDIGGRSLDSLEHKEALAKLRIFSGHNCLAHHFKRMDLIESDICVLCNQNSIMNLKHLFQCSSLNKERQQTKRKNGVKSKILVIRNN